MSKINIVILILGISILVFSILQLNINDGYINEINGKVLTETGYSIPYTFIEDDSTTAIASAILLHGDIGSKVTMKHIGITLARLGINAYLVDLPGYGESSIKQDLNEPKNEETVKFFYNWLRDNDKIINNDLILIGHLIGANACVNVSISKKHLRDTFPKLGYTKEQIENYEKCLIPNVKTTIIISEFPEKIISRNEPNNLFVILDKIGFNKEKDELSKYLSVKNETLQKDEKTIFNEEFGGNSNLKINHYPSANYFSVTYSQDIINDIADWIINIFKIDTIKIKYFNQSETRGLYFIGLLIGILFLIFPLSEIISKLWLFDFAKPKEPYKSEKVIFILLKMLISSSASIGLLMLFVLFKFIGIRFVDFIITIFTYQLIINIVLFRNYIFTAAKYDRQILIKILYSLLVSGVIFLLFGFISNIYITNMFFTIDRLLKFLIIFPISLIYFVMDEFIYRTELVFYKVSGFAYIKSFLASLFGKALIVVPLTFLSLFFFAIKVEMVLIYIVILSIIIIILQFISLYLFKKFKSYFITGFIAAFVFAWINVMILPFV